MSSTNRGTVRQKNDHYDTPAYSIKSLLDIHNITYPVLEPCAGNLAISNMLVNGDVITNDIDKNSPAHYHHDYLKNNHMYQGIRTIITNPPFNLALPIIEQSLKDVVEGGEVIMLLRLNFLGSQKRREFWRSAPLKFIYVLSKRPSFMHGRTDSIEYAWFIFEKGYIGNAVIKVL